MCYMFLVKGLKLIVSHKETHQCARVSGQLQTIPQTGNFKPN